MNTDPMQQLIDLRENYANMLDGELIKLAKDKASLSEAAQSVLTEELNKRGLDAEQELEDSRRIRRISLNPPADGLEEIEPSSSATAEFDEDNQFLDSRGNRFTYKVDLCEAESVDEARQIAEFLSRAGIECWLERGAASYPKVVVGADQLAQAQRIIEQPIPADIIAMFDDSNVPEQETEFEFPRCPKCGEQDPILEATEPTNQWLCESCEHQWSDPITEDSKESK